MFVNLIKRYLQSASFTKDPVAYARTIGVQVGEGCRLLVNRAAFGSEPYLIKLGDHVTVTAGVEFVTHDGGVWIFREEHPDIDVFGPIVVGNNVFIGFRSIILPGVTIGDNCVIGAGSVVTRDIPSNSVAAGVPARVIRSTDDYWKKVQENASYVRSLPFPQKREAILKEKMRRTVT